jgi:hypothetical protein
VASVSLLLRRGVGVKNAERHYGGDSPASAGYQRDFTLDRAVEDIREVRPQLCHGDGRVFIHAHECTAIGVTSSVHPCTLMYMDKRGDTTRRGTVTLANGETRVAGIIRTSDDLAALLGKAPVDTIGYWTGGNWGSGRWVVANEAVASTYRTA